MASGNNKKGMWVAVGFGFSLLFIILGFVWDANSDISRMSGTVSANTKDIAWINQKYTELKPTVTENKKDCEWLREEVDKNMETMIRELRELKEELRKMRK